MSSSHNSSAQPPAETEPEKSRPGVQLRGGFFPARSSTHFLFPHPHPHPNTPYLQLQERKRRAKEPAPDRPAGPHHAPHSGETRP